MLIGGIYLILTGFENPDIPVITFVSIGILYFWLVDFKMIFTPIEE